MMPNMDRLAEDWYRKWDPEFDDDDESDYQDCDEYEELREWEETK